MTAFVNLMSSAYEVSGCCTTDTVYPSFLRMLATASQPEPSANAPCTRTTFLMPVGDAAAATLTVPSSSRSAPISVAASVSGGITLLKHEPSAHIPWQNTILFFIFGIFVSFDLWFGCFYLVSLLSSQLCFQTGARCVRSVASRLFGCFRANMQI